MPSSLTPKLLRLFDPRIPRASATGRFAHAETVTGTHLYSYLQDQILPDSVVTARADTNGFADEAENVLDKFISDNLSSESVEKNKVVTGSRNVREVFLEADILASPSGIEAEKVNGEMKGEGEEEEFRYRTLLSQIKCTKDLTERLFSREHAHLSSLVETHLKDGSVRGSGKDIDKALKSSLTLRSVVDGVTIEVRSADSSFISEVALNLVSNGEETVILHATQTHAFTYLPSNSTCLHVCVLCRVEDRSYMACANLGKQISRIVPGASAENGPFPYDHIRLYEVARTQSLSLVGAFRAMSSGTMGEVSEVEITLFKLDLGGLVFTACDQPTGEYLSVPTQVAVISEVSTRSVFICSIKIFKSFLHTNILLPIIVLPSTSFACSIL